MKVLEIILEAKTAKAPTPRNFVAKHAKASGAGAHKDKKKAMKQGDVKHKAKAIAEGDARDEKDIINSGMPLKYIEQQLQQSGLEKDIRYFIQWAINNGSSHIEDAIELGNKAQSQNPEISYGLQRLKKYVGQGMAEGSDDLRDSVSEVLKTIYKGASAGENMIDYLADEFGQYYSEVEASGDQSLQNAYSYMMDNGQEAEDDPQAMAKIAKQAFFILKQGVAEGLNEFAPAGSGGGNIPRGPKTPRRGPWDDDGEDPYQLRRYNRSVDFFDQFDSDGVDKQNFDKATGEYEGYYFDRDAASGITQIAYFKFDDPTKIGDNDPGVGWYYEPVDEGVAEGSEPTVATLDAVFNEHDFYKLERIWPALEAGDKEEALRQINHYLNRGKNRAWWGDLQALDIKIDPSDVENSQVMWSKPIQQGVEEAGFVDVTGWSPSQVQAMGRADDDGIGYYSNRNKPNLVAWVFYNVEPGQEDQAATLNIRKLKSGKWAMPVYDKSGATYRFQRNKADQVFGPGKRWDIKKEQSNVDEEVSASTTSSGGSGFGTLGAIYPNVRGKTRKNKDGTAKNALDTKANLLTGGSIKR